MRRGVDYKWDDFPAALSGKYMQVEGRPDKMQVGLTQEVYINGSAGDIYVLGGWANAKSVPNATTTDKGFGFAARYYRMNNTWSDYLMLPMNGEWVGWQYGCFSLRVPEAYKRLEILCVYTKNANTAKFANLFLYREAIAVKSTVNQHEYRFVSPQGCSKNENTHVIIDI